MKTEQNIHISTAFFLYLGSQLEAFVRMSALISEMVYIKSPTFQTFWEKKKFFLDYLLLHHGILIYLQKEIVRDYFYSNGCNNSWKVIQIKDNISLSRFYIYYYISGHKGLTFNWREAGLHYGGPGIRDVNAGYNNLVQDWNQDFYDILPSDPIKVSNNGEYKEP